MFRNNIILMTAAIIIFLAQSSAYTQDRKAVLILDKNSYLPISDVSYRYGEVSGLSDSQGMIHIVYQQGLRLELSHISYGKWILEDEAVLKALRSGLIYREMSNINLYPVTVIAIRQPDDPGTITLEYEQKLAHDAGQILNESPAINSIRKSGSYGFDPVLRGFKYDQLNIVLNGAQGATAACPNRMDPPTSQMAPNMMDRIEVLKGPHALRYGTGVGGTINFIPARLRFSESSAVYGRLSGGYEGNGQIVHTEGMLGFSGEKHDISLFGAWATGNDYTSGNDTEVPADFMRASFGVNAGFKLSNDQQLRVTVNHNLARDTDFPALPMDLRKDDTWMFNARHDIRVNKGNLKSVNTTLFASLVDHLMDNLLKPLEPRMMNASTDASTYNYGGRIEGNWDFAESGLFAGADVRIEGAEGIRTREFLMGPNAGMIMTDNAWQNGRISKSAAFGEYHISSKVLNYVISGRFEINQAIINNPAPEFIAEYPETSITQFNPSISLGGIREFNNGSVGIWIGRAQRSGSLTERFINYFPVGQDPYELLGNPDLLPEKNNQVDLIFKLGKDRNQLNIDVFAGLLQDYITSFIDPSLSPRLPGSPGVRRYTNIDRAFKTGFEISWSQELILGLDHRLSVAYTYGQDMELDQPLPEIAPLDFRYILRGQYFGSRFSPELSFRHVLQQSRISEEFGETETPAFTLLDIKASYRLLDAFTMTAGVNNVFNTNYYEHLNRSVRGTMDPLFAPGRNIFVSFNYIF